MYIWVGADVDSQLGEIKELMQMRKEYNKLIRDRIPEMIAANGKTAQIRVLSDEE